MADKNLFSINITDDESQQFADKTPFTSTEIPQELWDKSAATWSAYAKYTLKKSGAIAGIRGASLVGIALTIWGAWQTFVHFLNTESGWTLAKAWADIPYALVICGVGILATIASVVTASIKDKAYAKDPQKFALEKEVKSIGEEIEQYLGVPDDALQIDVLPVYYRMVDDRFEEVLDADNVYQNQSVDMWVKDDCICMCDEQAIISIPKHAFKGYYTIDSTYTVTDWHKEDAPDDPKYQAFGVSDAHDGAEVHTYYDIVIEHGEDLYDLLIPSYDFPLLTSMVDLPCLDLEEEEI